VAQVEQAVKRRALELAQSRGVKVPADDVDFQLRARVMWVGGGAAAVVLEC
jgi:hypothetical protein